MPKVEEIKTTSGVIGLWKIEGDENLKFEELYGPIPEEVLNYHPRTGVQRIASRLLLYDMLGRRTEVSKDKYGRPSIPDAKEAMSISHTDGYAAVMIGKIASVDVQSFKPKIMRMMDRFLDTNEQHMVGREQDAILLWAAKETVYKFNAKPGLDFKDPITIHSVEPDHMDSSFEFEGKLTKLTLGWKMLDTAALVWVE